MAKKDKKEKKDKKKPKKEEVREPSETETHDEVVLYDTNLEPEEDVQFTDTSYTSASFESFQTDADIASTSESKFKKKGGKKGSRRESSQGVPASKTITPDPEQEPELSQDSLDGGQRSEDIKPEVNEEGTKKKKKKKKEKEEKEEKIVFEKPKQWKKMDKNARNAWLLQRMEEYKLEKEMEKQDQLLGAKEKRIQLAKERNELMKKDAADQNIRRDILAKTIVLFERSEKDRIEFEKKKEDWSQWIKYVRCDGLPNPYKVAELNTYIHLWQDDRECTVNDLEARCKDVLPILDKLEEIQSSHLQMSVTEMQNIAEIRKTLRSLLTEAIQCASYMILRNMHKNLKFESLTKATYAREFKTLLLNIWAAIKMPTKKKNKHHDPDPEPLELNFPNMKVGLVLPTTIDITCVCVRVALTLMDLRSEDSRTFNLVAEPPHVTEDLFTYNIREFEEIGKLKVEQDLVREAFYKTTNEKIKDLEKVIKNNPYLKNEKEKEEIENLLMAEPPPLTDPRTLIGERNEILHKKYLRQCLGRVRYGEVHLRKYRICGGVLQVDLLVTPPQPKPMRGEVFITTLQLPKCLQPMPYQVQYRAPGPPPPDVIRTPEEIEVELKKMEAAFEKLVQVSIDLPKNVMWTEPPVVCQWQEGRKIWTTTYINDYKFNEDKFTIQFRTGVLWPIGIATLRYSNLPFQGWDMKPDTNGKGVLVTVTGVNVTVTWLCRKSFIKLKSIANAPNQALNEHYDKPYTVQKMMKIMRAAACDFFPEYDAHNFVEGSCFKDFAMERHMYHAMAFLSRGYNFQWSRWNATAGSRVMVVQIREALDLRREVKLQLLRVTPQRVFILKGNEMMQEYEDEPMPNQDFYPDLFTLMMAYGSIDVKRAAFNMDPILTETIFELLLALKLCSFS